MTATVTHSSINIQLVRNFINLRGTDNISNHFCFVPATRANFCNELCIYFLAVKQLIKSPRRNSQFSYFLGRFHVLLISSLEPCQYQNSAQDENQSVRQSWQFDWFNKTY